MKTIKDQLDMCRSVNCSHGTVTEKGEAVFVSCDLTWNPIDWRETTLEEAELME